MSLFIRSLKELILGSLVKSSKSWSWAVKPSNIFATRLFQDKQRKFQSQNRFKDVLVMAILLFGVVAEANAALSSKDLTTTGDGLLTYDSDTGLSWLDLTATAGQSYNQIMAGYGGFTMVLGFRYATSDEVGGLFTAAGLSRGTISGSSEIGAQSTLMSLLGGYLYYNFWSIQSYGVTGSTSLSVRGVSHDYAMLGYDQFYGGTSYAYQAAGTFGDNDSSPNVGNFLVKDAATTPVKKFRWVNTGSISDCSGNDRRGLTEGVIPVSSECKDTTVGLVGICWDQITYHGAAATPVCTYKSLTPQACVGGASPGVVYQCQSVQATDQTNLIDFTYGTGAGSFELGNFVNNGSGYMSLLPNVTTIQGWKVGGPGNGVDWLISPSWRADKGINSVDLRSNNTSQNNASSIATVIPTEVGNIYRLTFGAATFSGYNDSGVVSAGSLVNQPFRAPISGSNTTQAFIQFTFLFTATNSNTEVRFTAFGGPNTTYGPVIDNVSVVSASDYFGGTLKAPANYEFTLEKNIPKTEAIQLINPGSVARSATLEVINPHSGLTVSVSSPSPVSVAPGETKSLPLDIDPDSLPIGGYDGLLLKIEVDDGTTLYTNIKVNIVSNGTANLPDLTLKSSDIGFSSTVPGDPVSLSAVIHNQGNSSATNVMVRFFEFGNLLGEKVLSQVPANGTSVTSIMVQLTATGDHLIRVAIDSLGTIAEVDETNNEASKVIRLGGGETGPSEGNILVSGSLPKTVYSNSIFTLSGRAVYDIVANGVRNTDYVVKGGSVQITVTGDDGANWVYGDVHTEINGNLGKALQAPATPGTYRIAMTVTDKTFIGRRELVFNVIEPPPPENPPLAPPAPPSTSGGVGHWIFSGGSGGSGGTWAWTWTTPPNAIAPSLPSSDLRVFSENIHFSNEHPAANEEITVFAEIQYWATNTDLLAVDVPVNLYATLPGSPSIKIGETGIDQLSVGKPDDGSRYVFFTWMNRSEGIYLIQAEIDPGYVEENMLNNAATRAIIVGQLQSHLGAIAGQVSDAWGGTIANVVLQLTEADGTQLGSTVTDQTGFYLIEDVPLGGMQVRIEAPDGYRADSATKTATVADSTISNVDFLLTQNAVPADTKPPVLSLPSAMRAEATGPTGAMVTYSASATDVEDGAVIPTCAPVTGGTFVLGTTSVTCSARDKAGNTASGSFNVTVRDTTPPTLVCPMDVSVMQGQQINLGTPVASDTVSVVPVLSNNASATFLVGAHSVIWTATDAAGNQASCTQRVTVSPAAVNQPPVADAGHDRTLRQGSLVTLSGSGSDPDHGPSALTFAWSQTRGSSVNLNAAGSAQPNFTPSTSGSYTFKLIVNDGADYSAPDTVQITIPMSCDIDLDGDVDRNDTSLITAARNRPALPGDSRDYDGDGTITVNDARACVLKCTRPVCASQ